MVNYTCNICNRDIDPIKEGPDPFKLEVKINGKSYGKRIHVCKDCEINENTVSILTKDFIQCLGFRYKFANKTESKAKIKINKTFEAKYYPELMNVNFTDIIKKIYNKELNQKAFEQFLFKISLEDLANAKKLGKNNKKIQYAEFKSPVTEYSFRLYNLIDYINIVANTIHAGKKFELYTMSTEELYSRAVEIWKIWHKEF